MNKLLILITILLPCSCIAQTNYDSRLEFTSDLESFESLWGLKAALQDVDIIALGENTHGLGEVFSAKTELVRYLHEELGFDLILFESGYGDAALAWEQLDSLSVRGYTQVFTSNFYYHSEEIENLISYVKSRNGALKIQGFDCQPQQNYLIRRMSEIAQPLDSVLAKSVSLEMRNFNMLYQLESNKDTLSFNNQRDRFTSFLNRYKAFLADSINGLLDAGTTLNEISVLNKSCDIFIKIYSTINIGEIMSWPAAENVRDRALLEIVNSFRDENPGSKIIIWAQNSHIENETKPNYNVNWMGHGLKKAYKDKYYSIGAVVYSGKNLNYNGSFDFEHDDPYYLAYHLNLFQKERYVLDLRSYPRDDFTDQLLLGMENSGATAEFIAKNRFDGLLFIRYSDIPTLIVPN